MRLLADENFPGSAISALADIGHDIAWIAALSPGLSDERVLDRAVREERILLTFDKDFGELAHSVIFPESCGVILFRIPMPPASVIAERLAAIVLSRHDWAGHFSVVEPGRVRMRKLSRPGLST